MLDLLLDLLLDIRSLFAMALSAAALLWAGGHVVLYKRDSRSATGWLALIVALPIVGAVLYWIFGINRIFRRAEAVYRAHDPAPEAEGLAVVEPSSVAREGLEHLATLAAFGERVTGAPLSSGNRVGPFFTVESAFDAMLAVIEGARHSISLVTYIFDHDRAGFRFLDALKDAVHRGVEVRVLIDAVGDRYTRPPMRGILEEAGVRCAVFMPTRAPRQLGNTNLRNHRKLLVVDGRHAFTGGLNIRRPQGDKIALQDLHFEVHGPVIHALQRVFIDDWAFTTGELLTGELWLPPLSAAGSMVTRVVDDGPAENLGHLRWTLLGALACARRRVIVITPYFLPDESLITALNMAARRGVEVDILIPAKSNLRIVQWACTAMLWQVLKGGCRIWATPAPFDHSKLMLVDGAWTFLGSANWDARSLRLNFELNMEVYCPMLTAELEAFVEDKRRRSRPITLEEVDGRPLPIRLRDGVARLLTPYL